MVNIKDWAKKKGISESDIQYDPATKKIKVRGVDYGKGTPTYKTQMQAVRPSDMTTYYKPAKVQSGTKFDEEVLDDTFNRGNLADAQRKQQTMQNQYMNTLTKGYKPGVFQYNQAKDPAYASAMSNAQQNIRNAQIQNLGDMQRRGLLNSSIATDRANQISADEMARIETQIAPQLEERAYNRYVQNEGMKRNQWQDDVQRLAAALGITKENTANMQGIVSTAEQKRQGIADALSKMYGTSVRATVDTDAMYNQVRGMKTAAEREAEAKRQALIEERMYKSKEADKQRTFDAEQKALERAAAKARASSGGSGGGSGSGESSASAKKPSLSSVKDVQALINAGAGVRKDQYGIKEIRDKSIIASTINNSNLSAKDRITLLENNGLLQEANNMRNDGWLKLASSPNPADKNKVLDMLLKINISDDELERKLIYYDLWEYANN